MKKHANDKLAALVALVVLAGCESTMETVRDEWDFSMETFQHATLDIASGDVVIRPGLAPSLTVEMTQDSGSSAAIDVQVVDDDLVITGGCEDEADCSQRLVLVLPAEGPIDVQLGSGTLDVSGMTGPVSAAVEHGSIAVENQSGPLSILSGDANVLLTNVSGPIDAALGSGLVRGRHLASRDVTLDLFSASADLIFDEAPENVLAESTSGDVSMAVPSMPYSLQLISGSGKVECSLVNADDIQRYIQIFTSTANITLIGR